MVSAKGWRTLKAGYGAAVEKLTTTLAKGDLKDAPGPALRLAENVATALRNVVLSSDADCAFYGLVFDGVDVADDARFFAAMGTNKGATVDTADGDEQPKLATWWGMNPAKAKAPKTLNLTDCLLGLEDEADVGDCLTEKEQAALAQAGRCLVETRVVVCGRLIVDRVVSVHFVVGRVATLTWAGVLSARVDT